MISITNHKVLDQWRDGRQTTGKITEALKNKNVWQTHFTETEALERVSIVF